MELKCTCRRPEEGQNGYMGQLVLHEHYKHTMSIYGIDAGPKFKYELCGAV